MITFICSIITNDQIQEYIGIVLMVLEAMLVVIKFLQYIVDPNSKFGKFLSKLLRGIKFVKDEAQHASNAIKEECKENERERQDKDTDGDCGG